MNAYLKCLFLCSIATWGNFTSGHGATTITINTEREPVEICWTEGLPDEHKPNDTNTTVNLDTGIADTAGIHHTIYSVDSLHYHFDKNQTNHILKIIDRMIIKNDTRMLYAFLNKNYHLEPFLKHLEAALKLIDSKKAALDFKDEAPEFRKVLADTRYNYSRE
jgi:hypothetical protein